MKKTKQLVFLFIIFIFYVSSASAQEDTLRTSTLPGYKKARDQNLKAVKIKMAYAYREHNDNVEGWVLTRILVSAEGKYVKHEILQASADIFQQQVEKHIHELKFWPANDGEQAVESWLEISFAFVIADRDFRLRCYKYGMTFEQYQRLEEIQRTSNFTDIEEMIGYPAEARAAGIEGIVTYRVLFDANGEHVKHKRKGRTSQILQAAVEKHISKLKMETKIYGGKAISFWTDVPFVFGKPYIIVE